MFYALVEGLEAGTVDLNGPIRVLIIQFKADRPFHVQLRRNVVTSKLSQQVAARKRSLKGELAVDPLEMSCCLHSDWQVRYSTEWPHTVDGTVLKSNSLTSSYCFYMWNLYYIVLCWSYRYTKHNNINPAQYSLVVNGLWYQAMNYSI